MNDELEKVAEGLYQDFRSRPLMEWANRETVFKVGVREGAKHERATVIERIKAESKKAKNINYTGELSISVEHLGKILDQLLAEEKKADR